MYSALLVIVTSSCSDSKKEQKAERFNPGIDTAVITTRQTLLDAARKLKAAMDEEKTKKDEPSYKKNYYVMLSYKATISRRMAAIVDTMPGNERAAFIKDYKEIFP